MLRELEKRGVTGTPIEADDVPSEIADLLASFQRAIVTALLDRVEAVHRRKGIRRLALAGGVAANSELRASAARWCRDNGVPLFLPDRSLTTDNAAMIAWAGLLRFRRDGPVAYRDANARSRWPLGSDVSSRA